MEKLSAIMLFYESAVQASCVLFFGEAQKTFALPEEVVCVMLYSSFIVET